MADTKLYDYPARLGDKQLVVVDHTGPSSYSTGGETIGASNNQTGISLLGLSGIDAIIGSGTFSVSGNYIVYAQPSGTGSRKTWSLVWRTAGTYDTTPVVISGASPFAYTVTRAGVVSVSGGTVSSITITRNSIVVPTGVIAGTFPVSANDVVTVTYSVAPTMYYFSDRSQAEADSGRDLSGEVVRLGYIGR